MINPSTYYTVQGWMREDLGLKDKELTVYAIIYGFSQDGSSEYNGSANYLAEWIGCSRPTIMAVLKALVEKGLLVKRDTYNNGVRFCSYTAVTALPNSLQGVKNFNRGVSNNLTGAVKDFNRGCKDSLQNNTRDKDRDNNRNINIGDAGASTDPAPDGEKDKKPVKHKHGDYGHVLLSDKDYKKLVADFGSDMMLAAVKYLDEYIEEKGYKSKNHNLAIRRWVIDAVKERQQKKGQGYRPARNGQAAGPVGPNGIAIDPTKTDLDGLFR